MSEQQSAEEWLTGLMGSGASEPVEAVEEEPAVRIDLDLGNAGVTLPASFQSPKAIASRAFSDWMSQ